MSRGGIQGRGMSWQAWMRMRMMWTHSRQLKDLKRLMDRAKKSVVAAGES